MWLQNLDNKQKFAGISFVLAKIINIIAVIFIFLIPVNIEVYKPLAIYTVTIGGLLIMLTIFLSLSSYFDKQETTNT